MPFSRRWIYWTLAIAACAATAILLSRRGEPVETVGVTQGTLTQTVVATGRIADETRIEITSQSTSRIESILVREGDAVKLGQVLVRLRDDEATASARQADAAVTEARMRIRQIQTVQAPVARQQYEQAQAAQQQAQQELVRTNELVRQGFVSQSRADEALRLARVSAAVLAAAQAQAQGSELTGVDTALAKARLDQALAAQSASQARLDTLSLRAPSSGSVISRHQDPGDTAQPGKAILTLVGGTEMRIHAGVDEKNLRYVKLGQTAKATADAFTDRPFDARLVYIAPAVDPLRGTVDLRLLVTPPVPWLKTDMTVSIEIVTAQVARALLLQTDALRKDDTGSPFVLVVREGKATPLMVKTGLQGAGSTEIVAGLNTNDRVILPGPQLQAGDRVREQKTLAPKGNAQPVPGLMN